MSLPNQNIEQTNNPLKNLYYWVLKFAEHRYAIPALFIIAFAEASFFPIPPDVLLLAMAMAIPSKSLYYALVCTIGSVLGGITGYLMGWGIWSSIDQWMYKYIPGFTEEKFMALSEKFANNVFETIFIAGFTPVPFKVFTVAAGAAVVPFFMFLIGCIISRGMRYGILAVIVMKLGPKAKEWIDRYFNTITIVAGIVVILLFFLIKNTQH